MTTNTDARDTDARSHAPAATQEAPHDWQSARYVQAWIAESEAQVPVRREQFELVADLIPHHSGAPIRILDLGAGWGPLSQHLLARFPASSATLLDFSLPMLDEARRRPAYAGERVRAVQADLSQPGSVADAVTAASLDAVVSSLCVHNLAAARVPELYREIRAVLAPGGCFVNLDLTSMGDASPVLRDAWRRVREGRQRRATTADTGVPSGPADRADHTSPAGDHGHPNHGRSDHDHARHAAPPPGIAIGRTALDHLHWLREAGFDPVDCFWREGHLALFAGFVPPA